MTDRTVLIHFTIDDDVAQGDEADLIHEVIADAVAEKVGLEGVRVVAVTLDEQTVIQWGYKIDCAAEGCNPVHSDDGDVFALTIERPDLVEGEHRSMNRHDVLVVTRLVVHGRWSDGHARR
jgi:hypothetical protein